MEEYSPAKEGKVRSVYDLGEYMIIVATDRISAFDVILGSTVPDKGRILNQMSEFWFDFTKDIVPNHMISTQTRDMPEFFRTAYFEGRSMKCRKLTMLPEPVFTPTTKAEIGLHDEQITFEECAEYLEKRYPGKGAQYAERIRDLSIEIYRRCFDYALEKGIIIADTKLEFGLDEKGEIVLGDEILTPDSSRFWPLEEYVPGRPEPSYDKQYIRDWLKANPENGNELTEEVVEKTRAKYIEAYQKLTGKEFVPSN